MENKRKVGKIYEDVAKDYLIKNGYEILETNYYTNIGEIDIIAKENGYICFIEVKYRAKKSLAKGLYAVNKEKQKTIYNVARVYLLKNKYSFDTACRFDVVSIDGNELTLIKNAFP